VTTFKDMIRRVRSEIREVSPAEARERADKAVLVDVREADEWAQGHVPGAVFIPRGFLELRVEEKVPDRAREVILYCAGGTRSALAARALQDLGYERVSSMAGGFGKWKESGFPIEVPRTLTAEQKQRYSRHLLVPEVGGAWAPPPGSTSPPPAWGRSGSSIRTSSTCRTCSGRSCTPTTPWASPRPNPGSARCARSTPT
jgi:rhodanese-related sulfurtransferase